MTCFMLPGGSRKVRTIFWRMLPGLDLYYADPPQPLTTAVEELAYISVDR